jgi:iron(III) transport system substrate-binding protein
MRRKLPWLLLLVLAASGCARPQSRVVLYSAQDEEFAEKILDQFNRKTGLQVASKYDTEATKSVSLATELVNEKARPRCDVWWNNEILSTIRLDRQGLLEPYASPSAEPYPAFAKSPSHTWHAFAARARILLVNTKLVKESDWPRSILDLTESRWKGLVGMAKPQFGTTATQAACLFEVLGTERAKKFFRDLRKNDIQIVAGNKQAAEGVSSGRFAVGLTDTDDAIIEVQAGKPVHIVFPDADRPTAERLGTLFIPNTVALIRGAPDAGSGRKLIDYLLSAEVESELSAAQSHQIPLNPQAKSHLPPEIKTPASAKPMDVNFEKAADLWEEVQKFLRNEFAR